MKTRLAALTVLLMAGAATTAFAQDQGEHRGHGDLSGGERPGMTPGQRPEARAWHAPAFTPHAPPPAPQARQAPAAPTPGPAPGGRWAGPAAGQWNGTRPSAPEVAAGGHWTPPAGGAGQGFRDHGAPHADHPRGPSPGGDHVFVRRPNTWVDTEGDNPNRNMSQADRNDAEDRQETRDWHRFNNGEFQGESRPPQIQSWGRDHGDRGDHRGDHGGRGDHGDHRGDRGDHHDWRDGGGDHHRPGPSADHPQWRPGAYPHSYRSHNRFHWRAYRYPSGFYGHVWGFGEFLPDAFFAPDYVIEDWWDFDLPEPPYGYDWVRVGSDALLVDEYDGRIVQVVSDLFW